MRVLISGACGVTSRAIARSLRMGRIFSDIFLLGTDICQNPYGLYEGLFDKIYRAPRVSDGAYREWMEELCKSEMPDAAIIVPELEVLFWSSIPFPVPALLPPPGFCQIAASKKRLYESLSGTGLVPRFSICSRIELERGHSAAFGYPCWVRDFVEGTAAGKGALLVRSAEEAHAWAMLNRDIDRFMISEYLPGRNFACHLLYDKGSIVKVASYERLEYFMARTVPSGVSGNISRGRLVNDPRLLEAGSRAVSAILNSTSETMNGIVAVDFRENGDGRPMITEINLRHVAATAAFAIAGFNVAEAHLSLTLGRRDTLGATEGQYTGDNLILRDIDGEPVWLPDHKEISVGEAVTRKAVAAPVPNSFCRPD